MMMGPQEELATGLTEIIRRIRSGGSVSKTEIEELMSKLSDLEDPYLREHLLTVLREIGRGEHGESDILAKLISYDISDLPKILDALQEFSYEDPFDELESRGIFEFWRLVLRDLARERRSSKRTTS